MGPGDQRRVPLGKHIPLGWGLQPSRPPRTHQTHAELQRGAAPSQMLTARFSRLHFPRGGQIRAGCMEINPFLPSTAALSRCLSAAPAQRPVPGLAGGRNLRPEGFAARAALARPTPQEFAAAGGGIVTQSPPRARQEEAGSRVGSQEHQAGGRDGGVGEAGSRHARSPSPLGR